LRQRNKISLRNTQIDSINFSTIITVEHINSSNKHHSRTH
jgi:hypothetical protein